MFGIKFFIISYLVMGLYCAILELPYTIRECKKKYTSKWGKQWQIKYNIRIIFTWIVDCINWDIDE